MSEQVADGAAVWESLKADVEALLLQAPTVALDALAHELAHLHAATKDQASPTCCMVCTQLGVRPHNAGA